MSGGDVVALVVALLTTLVSLLVVLASVVATLLSVLLPLAIVGVVLFLVSKQAGRGGLLVVQATPPAPKRLKKVACTQCGGSKVTPPKTAYVYCDYCGSLVDWDFRIACSTAGSARPGPAYEALQAQEGPKQKAAKDRGDREAYQASVRRVFDAHFTAAKGSWSPRLGDPDYRAALLEYTAQHYTLAAFDDDCVAKEAAMMHAVKGLQWAVGFQPKVGRASFEVLLDAVLAHNDRFVAVGQPLLDTHPDGPTADLQRKIARSAFAQGWMTTLDKAGQDHMIERLGLGGEYVDVPDAKTQERHCGGCGRTLAVVEGARKVVCEDCGHTNDVQHPEIRCSGCGGPVSVLFAKRSFRCPSCSTELRVDG